LYFVFCFCVITRKLSQAKWSEIYKSAGQLGNKKGFGYTTHRDRNKLPLPPELKTISPDIYFFELKVTGEARVHGFRVIDGFYLVWLKLTVAIFAPVRKQATGTLDNT
jgi:hypothetical protein